MVLGMNLFFKFSNYYSDLWCIKRTFLIHCLLGNEKSIFVSQSCVHGNFFCPFFSGILKYYPNNQELFCNLLLYLPENVLHLIKILLSFDIIFLKKANEFTIIIAAQNWMLTYSEKKINLTFGITAFNYFVRRGMIRFGSE